MSKQVFKPQINTLTDRANYLVHGAACAATFVVIGYHAPVIAVVALAGSLIINFAATRFATQAMQITFPATPKTDLPFGSQELPDEISNMSKELGMRPPSLYVFDEGPDCGRGATSAIRDALGEVFYKYANASAFGTSVFGLLASRPLLKELTPDEKSVVMAHELGHIKAEHAIQARNLNVLKVAADVTGWANYVFTLYSSWAGVEAWGIGIACSVVAQVGLQKLGLDPDIESHKAVLATVAEVTKVGGVLGVSALQGRMDVLAAWGLAKVLTTASKFFVERASRCREYQADRLAVETTRDPLSLVSALRKLDFYNRAVRSESGATKIIQAPKFIRDMFSTHPTTEKRCRRLEKTAERFVQLSLMPT